MSAHTPGPWVAVKNSCFWDINIAGSWLTVADACASKHLPDGDNGEANARLIAAAPELLEALKEMLVDYDDASGEWSGSDVIAKAYRIIDKARAAIAKAEGER